MAKSFTHENERAQRQDTGAARVQDDTPDPAEAAREALARSAFTRYLAGLREAPGPDTPPDAPVADVEEA